MCIRDSFNREIEDENDDVEPTAVEKKPSEEVMETNEGKGAEGEDNQPKVSTEKLTNKMHERVTVFENVVEINRFLKQQPVGSDCRQCVVQRIKF